MSMYTSRDKTVRIAYDTSLQVEKETIEYTYCVNQQD